MHRILVAYDGGGPARRALDTAAEMAKRFGATLAVVSVVPTCGRLPADPMTETAAHEHDLLEAQQILRENGIEAELLEPIGDPARTIERIADEGGYDAIVIGSRGLGESGKAPGASVSEHVATHARSTVVVAR